MEQSSNYFQALGANAQSLAPDQWVFFVGAVLFAALALLLVLGKGWLAGVAGHLRLLLAASLTWWALAFLLATFGTVPGLFSGLLGFFVSLPLSFVFLLVLATKDTYPRLRVLASHTFSGAFSALLMTLSLFIGLLSYGQTLAVTVWVFLAVVFGVTLVQATRSIAQYAHAQRNAQIKSVFQMVSLGYAVSVVLVIVTMVLWVLSFSGVKNLSLLTDSLLLAIVPLVGFGILPVLTLFKLVGAESAAQKLPFTTSDTPTDSPTESV